MARGPSPARRKVSPSLSRCDMSFGSAAISCSRTEAAFSNLDFLRWSATSSLSLRTSTWGFFAIGIYFYPYFPGSVSRGHACRIRCARLCASLAAAATAQPAAGGGRPMTVTPRRQRYALRAVARLGLLPGLLLEVLDLGARELAHFPGAHARHVDAAVVGPIELLHRRAHRFHQPLDEVWT